MKKKQIRRMRKALLLLSSVVVLMAIGVTATLAYLTDSEAVTNTFTVGQVGITLDETDTDELGNAIANAEPVTGNEYKLIPGHTYIKDPTVHMDAKSESAYVRMLVKVTDYADLLAICEAHNSDYVGEVVLLQNFVKWNHSEWPYYEAGFVHDTENDTATYEFRYHKTTDKQDAEYSLEPLFTEFTLPGYMTNRDLKALSRGYTYATAATATESANDPALAIDVTAHAIQAAGFDDADAAWGAFDAQMAAQANG